MKYSEQIHSDIIVTENSEISGLVIGDVKVTQKAHLEIHGMIRGDLYLETGTSAMVHGLVSGEVFGDSARLTVFGRVMGAVVLTPRHL